MLNGNNLPFKCPCGYLHLEPSERLICVHLWKLKVPSWEVPSKTLVVSWWDFLCVFFSISKYFQIRQYSWPFCRDRPTFLSLCGIWHNNFSMEIHWLCLALWESCVQTCLTPTWPEPNAPRGESQQTNILHPSILTFTRAARSNGGKTLETSGSQSFSLCGRSRVTSSHKAVLMPRQWTSGWKAPICSCCWKPLWGRVLVLSHLVILQHQRLMTDQKNSGITCVCRGNHRIMSILVEHAVSAAVLQTELCAVGKQKGFSYWDSTVVQRDGPWLDSWHGGLCAVTPASSHLQNSMYSNNIIDQQTWLFLFQNIMGHPCYTNHDLRPLLFSFCSSFSSLLQ